MQPSCRFVLDAEVQAISAKMDVVNTQLPVSPRASAVGLPALEMAGLVQAMPCRNAVVAGRPCPSCVCYSLEICWIPPWCCVSLVAWAQDPEEKGKLHKATADDLCTANMRLVPQSSAASRTHPVLHRRGCMHGQSATPAVCPQITQQSAKIGYKHSPDTSSLDQITVYPSAHLSGAASWVQKLRTLLYTCTSKTADAWLWRAPLHRILAFSR